MVVVRKILTPNLSTVLKKEGRYILCIRQFVPLHNLDYNVFKVASHIKKCSEV